MGELADASPAELLGTVAEHYTPETGMEEIAIWRAAHGGWLDPLVQAIRDCPFVSRRVAMLQTLVKAVPEGDDLLARVVARSGARAGRAACGETGPQTRGGEPGGRRLADGRKPAGVPRDRRSGRGTRRA